MARERRIRKHSNALLNELMYPIVCMILGVVSIIFGQNFLDVSGYVLGGSSIAAGLVFVIIYLTREAADNINRNEMLLGMASIAVGIIMLLRVDLFTEEIFPVILAGMVIISGADKLQLMVNMIKLKLPGWLPTMFVSVINMAIGIVLVILPKILEKSNDNIRTIMIITGAALVFSAISDVVFNVYYMKQFKERRVEDAPFREVPSHIVEK